MTRQKRLHERLEGGGDCAWNLHEKEMISPMHIFLLFVPSSLRPSVPSYLFPLFSCTMLWHEKQLLNVFDMLNCLSLL